MTPIKPNKIIFLQLIDESLKEDSIYCKQQMGGKHGKHAGTTDPRGDAYYGSNAGYNTHGKHDKHDKHGKQSGYDHHVASGSNVTPNAYGYTETHTDVYSNAHHTDDTKRHRVTPTEQIHIANRDQMHPELVSMVPVGPMADLRVSEDRNQAKVVTTQTTYLETPTTTQYQGNYQQPGVYPVVADTHHGHHDKHHNDHHDKHHKDHDKHHNDHHTTGYTNTVPLVTPVATNHINHNLATNNNAYPVNNTHLGQQVVQETQYVQTTTTTGNHGYDNIHTNTGHIGQPGVYQNTIGHVGQPGVYQNTTGHIGQPGVYQNTNTTANAYLNQNQNNLPYHDAGHNVPTVTNPNFPIDPNVNPNFPANPQGYVNNLDHRENHPSI